MRSEVFSADSRRDQAMSEPPQKSWKVLHVIDTLGSSGGAEQQLAANLAHFTDPRLEHHVAAIFPATSGRLDAEIAEVARSVTVLYPDKTSGSRLGAMRRLDRLVGTLSPDLMHCSLAVASLATRFVGWRRRIPVVESLVNISHEDIRTVDNPNVTRWKLRVHRLVDRVTMRAVTRFHAISHTVARSWVETVGIPESKITVIPRGVDVENLNRLAELGPSRKELLDSLGLPPDARIILNVGRHEPQKGQRYLIEAMAEIVASRPDAILLIVGREGNSTIELDRLISELGLSDTVRLLGPRDDVPALMRAADIFAFPSLFEGLGVALLEAMALGAPVVASDTPPVNQVCEHGRGGLLCEPANPDDLVRAIHETFDDPDGAMERRLRARRRVLSDFSVELTSSRVEGCCLELLSREE